MDDLVTSSTLPPFQIRNNMYNKKNITTIKEGGFQMNIKLQYKRKLQLQQKPHHTKKGYWLVILLPRQ